MARKSKDFQVSQTVSEISENLIEVQVFLTHRGRSVLNGTMLVKGQVRTFKHDLPELVRNKLSEAISSALIDLEKLESSLGRLTDL